ncbi:Fic family protein [Serinibacter arcticus]|uniref:Fic family protein n=1 Tax=Serinibacter arcticus TaxID=1655435 RepID=UPI001091D069|nr:Fic family protein [Serinibacter arcticus]
MTLGPGYGETPLGFDELDALLPSVRNMLGEPVTKAAVYEIEQAYEEEVRAALAPAAGNGDLPVEELLTTATLRDLHARLYENVWTWAGALRTREVSIGVAPEQVAIELHASLGNLAWRWQHTPWTARELAMAVHAEAVRIHPFVDGNGRSTRLLADLVLLAARDDDDLPAVFDWAVDKVAYIQALRQYDQTRDSTELAALVGLTLID